MEDCAVPKQGKPSVKMDLEFFYKRKRLFLLYYSGSLNSAVFRRLAERFALRLT